MKVLFLQQDIFKSYGIMTLSSLIKSKGHQADILVESLEKDFIKKAIASKPDVICFSVPSARLSWLKQTAKRVKPSGALIVVGGPHATFFPEVIENPCIDVACVGEGEHAFVEMLDKLEKGQSIARIKNLVVKQGDTICKNPIRNLIDDLDSLPFADRTLYLKYEFFRHQNSDIFMTARGCPYSCTFCFNKRYNELYKGKGKIMRRASVTRLISEIRHAVSLNGNIKHLVFLDDTFILAPKEWIDKFFLQYKEIGLPYSINARADLVSEELIAKLKKSGCHSIRMGIESANDYIREKVLRKGISKEQIVNACSLIKKHGISLQINNVIGIPGETLETALETYELAKNTHPVHAWCSLMQPYPGTEIADIAASKGLIKKGFCVDDLENSYFFNLPLSFKDRNQLISLQRLFQFGNLLRIPTKVMRLLIKIPPNALFDFVFKANYGLGIKRLDNVSWLNLFRTALFSGRYFKKKTAAKA